MKQWSIEHQIIKGCEIILQHYLKSKISPNSALKLESKEYEKNENWN